MSERWHEPTARAILRYCAEHARTSLEVRDVVDWIEDRLERQHEARHASDGFEGETLTSEELQERYPDA